MTEAMLFAAATEIRSAAERAAYLDQACGNDASLRRRIDELLVAHQVAGGFLEEPANAVNQAQSAEAWPTLEPRPAARDTEGAGSMIGRYELLQQIGEGGFGAVWLAEQRQPVKRKAALKIIKLGMDTKQVIARFEAERQALAMMDHPNIAKVLDAGATESGRPYFVMELVKGVPITEYCDTNNLATVDRLALFVSVCHAIQHAHQKGIIHRDIKPSNILVTLHDGVPVPKVIDFGIAKATNAELTEKTLFTEHRQMIGTPAYMSPEQAEMSGLDIDTRSDIYSLGVLLYELLTGTTPFDAAELKKAGLAEIQRIIREDDPPRPSTRVSTMGNQALTPIAKNRATEPRKLSMLIRGDLDWIVMKALEKDRTRRYETANSLAMDIKRHLNDEAVTASPPGKLYKFRKTVRRNKLVFSAVGGVTVAMLLGLVMSLWQAGRAQREADRAQREAQRASAALDDLRASAPAFAEQARGLAAMERFGEAIEKLDYAAKLRPDVAEYILAKADLLRCQLRLTDAAQTYRAALKIKPDLARAKADAELCDQLIAAPEGAGGKLTRESLSRLNEAMIKEQRPAVELMQVARLLGDEKKLIVDYWLARLKTLPISPDKPLDKRLTVRDDGLLALDLSKTKITDLAVLEGMPLGALDLTQCDQVTDLGLLHGMPLKELILTATGVRDITSLREFSALEKLELFSTAVSDLSPLRGLRLQKLAIGYTTVTDLAPLSGMPLKDFNASAVPALDFSVLAGMPLEQCVLQGTRVHDLSFLRGAPVKMLALNGCTEIRNLRVLSDIKTLEILYLPPNFADLPPEEVAALESLRTHPALKQITADWMRGMNFSTAKSKELFWKDWDSIQAFAAPLRKAGVTFSRYKELDGTWTVTIRKQSMTDLSMFKDMPIGDLTLEDCKLGKDSDLTPLRSMPVVRLILNHNPITDLGPLRGLKLERLELVGTQVADLAPLKGMPLKFVDLRECSQLKEAAPLADLPALEDVLLPMHVTDLEPLRKLPNLKHVSYSRGPGREPFACTAAEFWKTWDGLPWARKLEAAGIAFSFEQSSGGFYDVTVHDRKLTDVAIFKGSNVRRLYIGGSGVADLSPLADLPLAVLSVGDTSVADLSALRSPVLRDALREIRLGRTQASDYSPIAACVNLETLDASDSTLKDLSVLTGMKLRTLKLGGTAVTDIAPVAGMPLETVYLAGTKVTDLSPLLKCPTLKSLLLPEDVRDFESLRALPKLARISYTEKGGEPDKTAGQFWDDNKEQPWLAALRETKLTYKTRVLKDGSWELILDHQPITDLAMLKGARITRLSMSDAPVADLSPLRGMKLAYLRISSTKVTDLSPIRGMPITNLTMTKTNVRDLTPLVGMPLRGLYMGDCAQVTDLSPLTEMKTLDTITLPPAAKNIEFLRKFPILKRIGFAQASSQTADDFWADYDRKAESATISATTKPTAD